MTAGLRETPPAAVHASRVAGPITRQVVLRVLGVATGVAVFVSLLIPFRGMAGLLGNALEALVFSWAGSLIGLVCARFVLRLGVWRYGRIATAAATGLLMAAPMIAVVWTVNSVVQGHPIALRYVPGMAWYVVLICLGGSWLGATVGSRQAALAAATAPAPPKFLERLPLKLRGAEVWAVEAEDHYLRLHTSKGQDLILMRLADAVAELEGIEGMQVHRSWWVARNAITDAKRGDGRATLTLKDGAQVPVSRTYAAELRQRGWI